MSKKNQSKFDAAKYIRQQGLGAKVAAACGISRQAVPQWRRVPAERVITVEKVIGISRYLIRPDIYQEE
jgi:DNA-binding transcriptional regulator YdaS (Cro superfamily)